MQGRPEREVILPISLVGSQRSPFQDPSAQFTTDPGVQAELYSSLSLAIVMGSFETCSCLGREGGRAERILFLRWGDLGPERASDLPKTTQQMYSRAGQEPGPPASHSHPSLLPQH